MKSIRKMELKWKRVSVVRENKAEYSKHVTNSMETASVLNSLIGDEVHEVVIAIHLNQKNLVVGYHEVSRGGATGSAVTPADVFRPALLSGAVRIIISHNHPSGEPIPSAEDVAFTKRIASAGEILGVKLLDHIIVADGKFYSFLDNGLMGSSRFSKHVRSPNRRSEAIRGKEARTYRRYCVLRTWSGFG